MNQRLSLDIPNDLNVVAARTAHLRGMTMNEFLLDAVLQSVMKFHDAEAALKKEIRLRKPSSDGRALAAHVANA